MNNKQNICNPVIVPAVAGGSAFQKGRIGMTEILKLRCSIPKYRSFHLTVDDVFSSLGIEGDFESAAVCLGKYPYIALGIGEAQITIKYIEQVQVEETEKADIYTITCLDHSGWPLWKPREVEYSIWCEK